MRARLPLLAALLAAGLPGWAAPPPAGGTQVLECGDVAPFDNTCNGGDCCAEFRGEASPEVTLLAYEGGLDVRLKAVDDDGADAWTWQCWALFVPSAPGTPATEPMELLSGCEGPVETGRLKRGADVRLDCFPRPLAVSAAPPAGPYGCKVYVPED